MRELPVVSMLGEMCPQPFYLPISIIKAMQA
jgi:hypothetical protein